MLLWSCEEDIKQFCVKWDEIKIDTMTSTIFLNKVLQNITDKNTDLTAVL